MDHHQQSRPVQRSRASLIVLIVLAFLLMAASIVLVFSLPEDAAWQVPQVTTTSPADNLAGFTCSDSDSQRMYPFSDGVIRLGNERISLLDSQGTERFGADTAMSSPLVYISGPFFLVADRGGYTFLVADDKGVRFSGTAEGRISSAAVSTQGSVAIIQEQSDGTGIVSLYAPTSGKKLFDCYNPESGYPLSVSFPEEDAVFDVALANTSGAALRPVIKRYALTGSQLGQRIPDLAELMPLIVYDGNQHPVLCGETSLVSLAYDQESIIWRTDFFQVLTIRQKESEILVLARDRQDGPCSLYCLRADGTIRFSLLLAGTPASLAVSGSLAVTGGGTHVTVIDCKKGIAILDQDMAAEIIRVGFAGSNSVTVISRGQVRRLNIPQ